MPNFRNAIKIAFALLALWLGLVWLTVFPRPAFLPPDMDIEPLTYLLGILAASLLAFWKTPNPTSSPSSAKTAADKLEPSLQDELIANLKAKYQKRIDSKLAGRFPVNLRLTASQKGTTEEMAQNFITLQDEEVGREIGEIFDRAHGRLLVVGLPGAGKTTLLLQLALELLKRAETVPATLVAGPPADKAAGTAIPVLLNLATWRTEFATFDEWLRRILPNELGASKALAEKIRAHTPLILLLDGLDEVPKQDRNSCLEALGQYGMKPEHQFARFVLRLRNPYQRFKLNLKILGFTVIGHLFLRLLLTLQSSLPLRLVHFLNEMSRRHLLEFDGNLDTESGGGAWRWRHRIIQEYFLNDERETMNKER